MRNPQSSSEDLTGRATSRNDSTRLYSKTPTAQRAFEAADLPGWCHRFSTAVDRAAFAGSMIGFGHAKLFCGAGKFF